MVMVFDRVPSPVLRRISAPVVRTGHFCAQHGILPPEIPARYIHLLRQHDVFACETRPILFKLGDRMSTCRLLHVEDEPDIREVVEMSLALDPDITLKSCASGPEALVAA